MDDSLLQFSEGAIMMCYLVAGLFFLRFWRRTRDRLFLIFSISFCMMAINRICLSFMTERGVTPDEDRTWLYVVRLAAFILILLAIIDKNRANAPARNQPQA